VSLTPETGARDSRLALLVPDSGRTWSVLYHEIRLIPPSAILLGDVFIVRHSDNPGVMIMQATAPHENAWHLEALEFSPEGDG
jgi:hypothetical protein